jgi:succinyl-CoA synthetase alpha subunit
MMGVIGGTAEENAAAFVKQRITKPVAAFIAGQTAPPGKRMGHAGALISGGADTADAKLQIMEACGIKVTKNPSEMARLLKAML